MADDKKDLKPEEQPNGGPDMPEQQPPTPPKQEAEKTDPVKVPPEQEEKSDAAGR